MGIEDRDWYRDEPRRGRSLAFWVIGAIILVAGLLAASPAGQSALGLRHTPAAGPGAAAVKTPGVVLSGTTVVDGTSPRPLYPPLDPWRRYLADERTCPGGERTDLPPLQQVQVMLCLINWARQKAGLNALPQTALLASTAQQKADEIVRCSNFAHSPCGASPDADVRTAGYPGSFGENLYIAGGGEGAPRVALDGWLNSPGHRENLFLPEWRTQGVALVKLPHFGVYDDMTLWVSHFGSD